MEPPGEKAACTIAGNAESPPNSSNSEPPGVTASQQQRPNTAIERQIAATSALGCCERAHQDAVRGTAGPHKTRSNTNRRNYQRVGLASVALFLLIAAGLASVFTVHDRPLQRAVSAVRQMVAQATTTHNPSHNPSPAGAAQTAAPKKVAEVLTPAALSIPISDVSLRSRPELLEQLVQVYRSRLAAVPNDSVALDALNQLQERSLSELEAIIRESDDSTASRSLQLISRLFPELADNPRYRYLNARMDYIHRQAKGEPEVKPESSAPLAATVSSETTASQKSVSAPHDSSAVVAKKAVENTPSLKPEIRTVSIIPGTMVDDRFTPGENGNVFMVEISYRNFDKVSEDQSDVTLVTRLGIPGDSTALAEVPVEIFGNRGKKSFLMETLMPGSPGEKYQVNFILNGEFLASRVVRLSMSAN